MSLDRSRVARDAASGRDCRSRTAVDVLYLPYGLRIQMLTVMLSSLADLPGYSFFLTSSTTTTTTTSLLYSLHSPRTTTLVYYP